MDTALSRPGFARRVPARQLLILALVGLLAIASAAYLVGSQKRVPAPFGPAGNGQIIYGVDGDLYVRDTLDGEARLLLGGPADQGGVVASPDGQLIAYDNVVAGIDTVWVADIDGANPRQILEEPFTGLAFQWAYDSASALVITEAFGHPRLWIAPADGSGAREIEFETFWPYEATWDPAQPGVLLVRGSDRLNGNVDMYYVDATTGAILSKIDLVGGNLYGPTYEFAGMAFSPDGQMIAYNVVESDVGGGEHFWVRLMNRDGSDDRLVALPEDRTGVYSQAWSVFSPDGKWIAMESWAGPVGGSVVNQLALAPTDGASPTRLLGPSVPNRSIVKVWSPDGTRILIHVNDIDDMYTIDPITGVYEQLPWKSDFPNWQRVAP